MPFYTRGSLVSVFQLCSPVTVAPSSRAPSGRSCARCSAPNTSSPLRTGLKPMEWWNASTDASKTRCAPVLLALTGSTIFPGCSLAFALHLVRNLLRPLLNMLSARPYMFQASSYMTQDSELLSTAIFLVLHLSHLDITGRLLRRFSLPSSRPPSSTSGPTPSPSLPSPLSTPARSA